MFGGGGGWGVRGWVGGGNRRLWPQNLKENSDARGPVSLFSRHSASLIISLIACQVP